MISLVLVTQDLLHVSFLPGTSRASLQGSHRYSTGMMGIKGSGTRNTQADDTSEEVMMRCCDVMSFSHSICISGRSYTFLTGLKGFFVF